MGADQRKIGSHRYKSEKACAQIEERRLLWVRIRERVGYRSERWYRSGPEYRLESYICFRYNTAFVNFGTSATEQMSFNAYLFSIFRVACPCFIL